MIIVSGATGFLGRYLVDHLVKAGEKVIAVGRTRRYDSFFPRIGGALRASGCHQTRGLQESAVRAREGLHSPCGDHSGSLPGRSAGYFP